MPITDFFAAFRWWSVIVVLGAIAFPLTFNLLRILPDKGYAFSKMVGILVLSFVFWLGGSLGFLQNDLGGIFFALGVLVALSIFSWRNVYQSSDQTPSIRVWLRENRTYILIVEGIFLVLFIAWAIVRSQNPAIVATEKPMDFAFLNASSRSLAIPPLDPWLSGFAISYYYFGYLMTSLIARLAFVQEAIAFNLSLAWLVAGTALGAFGVVYNLIRAEAHRIYRGVLIASLVAAIAVPLAGNLEILLEIGYANGIGSDSLWSWLDVRDLTDLSRSSDIPRYQTSQWWWWRSSRVIHEYHLSGRAEEGLEPIAEFPAFSFVLGDMHPHVLSLPFSFLAIAIAQSWWLQSAHPSFDLRTIFRKRGLLREIRNWPKGGRQLFLFTAILLGGLSFLNTWDVLIYLFIVVGAFILARWRDTGEFKSLIIYQALPTTVFLVLLAIVFYLPFYLGFRSQAGPPFLLPMSMMPTRFGHFLVIFGMPLLSIAALIGTLLSWGVRQSNNQSRRIPLRAGIAFSLGILALLFGFMIVLGWIIAASPEGSVRVSQLLEELGLLSESPPVSGSIAEFLPWATSAIIGLAPKYLAARLSQPALIIFLCLTLGGVVFLLTWIFQRSGQQESENEVMAIESIRSSSLPFVLLLIGTAFLLALGPEFVYLRDNFGQRLNTIFKFYYQIWVILGVAAVYGMVFLLNRFKNIGRIVVVSYAVLLSVSLLFPIYAIRSRAIEYRGPFEAEDRLPATLNGLDYLKHREPDEYDAIVWLQERVQGTPVIVEAVGGQYSSFGRVAASTGLPTLLGWAGHEYQWRGNTPEPAEREPAIRTIYSASNWSETKELLDKYDISYVYFGSLERSTYDPRAAEKFEQNMDVAFENSSVTIYRYQN